MLPALIVGALTAWYLGLRSGIIVAVAVAIAMFVAMVVPHGVAKPDVVYRLYCSVWPAPSSIQGRAARDPGSS